MSSKELGRRKDVRRAWEEKGCACTFSLCQKEGEFPLKHISCYGRCCHQLGQAARAAWERKHHRRKLTWIASPAAAACFLPGLTQCFPRLKINHFGFIGARSRPPAEACRHHRQPHWFGNEQLMHFAFLMLICYLLAVFVGDVFILICRLKMITTFSFHLATDVRPLPHSVRCVYLSCTPLSRTTASPQDHFCLA